MSKITFRADEDLIRRIETFDASKSEVMRNALREYLDARTEPQSERPDAAEPNVARPEEPTLDALITERVDELINQRLTERRPDRGAQDVNVNVTLERDSPVSQSPEPARESSTRPSGASDTSSNECAQCGELLDDNHVFCPNCGEKAAHRVFCECGDELRTDWAFCPGCGRRTPSADVLDRS